MSAFYISELSKGVIQSAPDCFARIVRFKRRDTRDYRDKRPRVIVNEGKGKADTGNPSGIRHDISRLKDEKEVLVLDIGSDITQCTINKSKTSPVGTFTLVLAAGDINYHHAVNPGDHIFIWMRRNRRSLKKTRGVIGKEEENGGANNSKASGLKLYGVITSVRRIFRTDPSGKKLLMYQISGKDFGYFFEASIYYNQAAAGLISNSKFFEFTGFGTFGGAQSPDNIVMRMLDIYFGSKYLEEFHKLKLKDKKDRPVRPVSENVQMYIPPEVQSVFGVTDPRFVTLLDRRVGIEQYDNHTVRPTYKPMSGMKAIHVDVGSHYPVWSALKAYSNPTINEMFLDLKQREDGLLYPAFVCRQIPFTSKAGAKAFAHLGLLTTKFVDLPRIRIPENFILSEDIGRGDHERFNFIELFGTFPGIEDLVTVPMQMYQGNFAIDTASVKRYGLRPLITQSDFHFPDLTSINNTKTAKGNEEPQAWTMVPKWINLMADWYLAAHTLESGTFSMVGIEEPLSLGDNIEIERQKGVNELYHVEGYTHAYTVDMGSGTKTFRTSIEVSRGQRIDEYPVYVSGSLNEDDQLAVGLSDYEETGMARPETSVTAEHSGISENEIPSDRKKKP